MNNVLSAMTSDQSVLAKLKKAAQVQMSDADRFEQRVSFVFGSLGKNNTMTKADVRAQLRHQVGDLLQTVK
ncbi:MAG: hypothetical protein HY020_21280 [Burkholderiales bacterium]|nr:hypothetical protein [Burkholderiales bacterium]